MRGGLRPNCSMEGCTKPHFGNGLCNMHYQRVRNGKDPDYDPQEHLRPKQQPTREEVIWTAGFLEGEGCFQLSKSGSSHVSASQVNSEPIAKLKLWFGGSVSLRVHENEKHSDVFNWAISGDRARNLMLAIYEFMSEHRKAQIDVALRRGHV